MNSDSYKTIQKCFVVLAFLVFVLSLTFATLNQFIFPELFYSSLTVNETNKYYQEVTPISAAFIIIWPIIFLWNAAAILYILISAFLPENKNPVNVEPTLIPIKLLVSYMVAFGASTAWLFVYDREILGLGFFLLLLSAASLYITLGVSYKKVYDNLRILDTKEKRAMLWYVRILIQNGLGLPATWLTLATFLNLADVIIYQDSFGLAIGVQRGTISIENGSTAVLAIVFVIIIVWFILDNFVFHEYTRYTFTIFPVFILGLSGLVAKLQREATTNQNLIFASVMLAFSCVALIVRVMLFIYRGHGSRNAVENKKEKISDEKV